EGWANRVAPEKHDEPTADEQRTLAGVELRRRFLAVHTGHRRSVHDRPAMTIAKSCACVELTCGEVIGCGFRLSWASSRRTPVSTLKTDAHTEHFASRG